MADEVKPVELGTLTIDATPLASFLVDQPPGALQGMRSEHEGYGEAVIEILSNQTKWGDQAGVTTGDMDVLALANERIAQIDALLPAASKLVEMLLETRATLDDQRQRRVSAIAQAVEGRARTLKSPELLAKYEKTRAYRSAIAMKGVRTRRRNGAAAEAAPVAHSPAVEG